MLDRHQAERLFLENLRWIERVLAMLSRRQGLSGDDADDFASWAKLRLIEDDYAAIRRFRGESAPATYLTVVLSMLARDYRVRERGRWRPSAAARRLGPVAVRLETLVHRDGFTLTQAAQMLRTTGYGELADRELAELWRQLPARPPLRPVAAGDEVAAALPTDEQADVRVLAQESERRRDEAEQAVAQAVASLPDEDQVIVRMRVWHEMTVADVARGLNLPQKPLYRRMDRIFSQLRRTLEAGGLSRERVRGLLEDRAP
jgi:RNA polymerase sigma factor for flagellar operon FliA